MTRDEITTMRVPALRTAADELGVPHRLTESADELRVAVRAALRSREAVTEVRRRRPKGRRR